MRNWSLAKTLANLPKDEQENLLRKLDPKVRKKLLNSWRFLGRPSQFAPEGDWSFWFLLMGRGGGKMLCDYEDLPTPLGYRKLKDLQVGDFVFDEDGQPTKILAIHKPKVEKAYRLTFSDGETIDCCADHLWVTWDHSARKAFNRSRYESGGIPDNWPVWRPKKIVGKTPKVDADGPGPRVRTTQEIVDTFTQGKRGDTNHSIPLTKPLQFPEAELETDPWTLGYWLGNGSHRSVYAHSEDADHVESRWVGGLGTRRDESPKLCCHWSVPKEVIPECLEGTKARTKFVPKEYLLASEQQRRDLLAGLLDSDGHLAIHNSYVEFCSMSKQLAEDVLYLARSLGEKATIAEAESSCYGRTYGTKYRVTWRPIVNPFYSPRKSKAFIPPDGQESRNHHRMIVKYEEIPPKPMRCLTVDSPNSMFLVGKGMIPTHNTRSGAEWIVEQALAYPGARIAAIGPTAGDVRDTMIEGESGLMACAERAGAGAEYFPSKRRIVFPNNSWVVCFSAEEPERLRGPQFHVFWADEIASWNNSIAVWDMLMFCLRLGQHPRGVITSTPKPTKLVKQLVDDKRCIVVRGSTFDNADNLAPIFREQLLEKYSGTRLGRQEIDAEILDDAPGALWVQPVIDATRIETAPKLFTTVIGVDPAVSANKNSDLTGIVVAASDPNGYYVLEDRSGKYKPGEWAEIVFTLYNKYKADLIVAETNQGGDMVKAVLTQKFESEGIVEIPFKGIHAAQGKRARAEPISLLYEQGKVHHVGELELLEIELCTWDPNESNNSPDRLDAMVWALTELYKKGRLYADVQIDPTMGLGLSPWGKNER
jgi:predicted phage terminase large subunit-like protein